MIEQDYWLYWMLFGFFLISIAILIFNCIKINIIELVYCGVSALIVGLFVKYLTMIPFYAQAITFCILSIVIVHFKSRQNIPTNKPQ